MDDAPEFSRKIDVSRLAPEGSEERVDATKEECAALTLRFDADEVHALSAAVTLRPWKRGSCRARGTATVRMTRTCVVSLEPFESTIKVELDRLFVRRPSIHADGKEIVIEPQEDDFGEIENGFVEIGEFVVEELLLELDPHPRKPGVEFDAAAVESEPAEGREAADNPFTVLKSLKDNN